MSEGGKAQAGWGFHRIRSVPTISGLTALRTAVRVDCGMFHLVSSARIARIREGYSGDSKTGTTMTAETLVDGDGVSALRGLKEDETVATVVVKTERLCFNHPPMLAA